MNGRYGFVLEWTDLPKEIQEKKIDDWITHDYELEEEEEESGIPVEDILKDPFKRQEAEREISERFPICF